MQAIMTLNRRRHSARRGFNLIEAAIVLGIVGLVVGGIWVAATSVYANLRSKTATDQLLKIGQGVRSMYATSSNLGNAALDMTPFMAQSGVLPNDTLTTAPNLATAANTVNPWGGQVGVVAPVNNATNFIVQFNNIPSKACVDFVLRNTGVSRDSGMTAVYYGVTGAVNAPLGANIAMAPGVALSNANAALICDTAGGGIRAVGFLFALRG